MTVHIQRGDYVQVTAGRYAGISVSIIADGPDLVITLRQVSVIDGDLVHTGT